VGQRLILAAYPASDLVLLAVVARLLTRGGRPNRSLLLLVAGIAGLLYSDVGYQVVIAWAPAFEGAIAVGWLLANTFWAAAALDRSSAAQAPVRARDGRMGRTRLVFLTASMLLIPALLAGGRFSAAERGAGGWVAIGIGAVVLFSLVFARMSGFVLQVRRQARQLEDLALRDPLTGLANRRVFEERLAAAVAAGPGHSPQVAVLDLNGFKDVNDRLGHTVGDKLLVVVATRLARSVREGDLVARLGGDEFAVLLPDAHFTVMDSIAERMATTLRRPIEADGHQLLVSASIGSADGTGLDRPGELLRRADLAMYAAKEAGGARHRRYTRDLDRRAGEEAKLGAELRAALDTGQFQVVYQPIVELPSGRTRSVEALVRWHHPQRGPVSPAEFIPVAEHNGMIVELGEWILRTACAQAAAWQRELGTAAPQRMSVNVSARQLAEPGFAGLVAATLSATGLAAHQLIVEVTETAVFGGGQAVQAVQDLHELGVRIALDDFGTGHSSLGLLQTVPVDILKVDKSFVDTITMAGRHAVIATALIQVAGGLGLEAVAEGVETAEQAAELHRLGYRLAQGYHFGRPAAVPDFAAALA
jgi:diguanylate cyclase